MPPASLLRAWKTRLWMQRLSGLTFEPSTAASGVAAWISSLRDIRASRFPSPDASKPNAIHGTSGRTSATSLPSCGQGSLFSRTYPTIYDWDSNRSTMTFEVWVTALRRVCLRRKKSARRISANDCSYWPTPRAQEPGSTSSTHGKGLAETAKAWPTPVARDWKDSPGMRDRITRQVSLANMAFRSGRQVQATSTHGEPSQMRLNPLFTEGLMGWPAGWTVCGSVATAWSRWLPRMRSELFRLTSKVNHHE